MARHDDGRRAARPGLIVREARADEGDELRTLFTAAYGQYAADGAAMLSLHTVSFTPDAIRL